MRVVLSKLRNPNGNATRRPFGTPVLGFEDTKHNNNNSEDQKEYVQKLERSFASRRWCDHGTATWQYFCCKRLAAPCSMTSSRKDIF